jgi:ArsR family transcriptional regulator
MLPIVTTGCCSPLSGEVLSADQAEVLAASLKAIADPTRLRLISLVAAYEGGEACVCDLIEPIGLSQPTVSHHLRLLVEAGVMAREQRGKWAARGARRDRRADRSGGDALTLRECGSWMS